MELRKIKILARIPQGKRPFGKHRRRWKDNIKIHFREIRSGGWAGFK
jgi:hypothetical protein